ncbi:hypothetical protein SUGI_0113150 [Cryptomeria japonica]|nr:hypothetical protein SUGI_0113150 [Cryptomeria japonica]
MFRFHNARGSDEKLIFKKYDKFVRNNEEGEVLVEELHIMNIRSLPPPMHFSMDCLTRDIVEEYIVKERFSAEDFVFVEAAQDCGYASKRKNADGLLFCNNLIVTGNTRILSMLFSVDTLDY